MSEKKAASAGPAAAPAPQKLGSIAKVPKVPKSHTVAHPMYGVHESNFLAQSYTAEKRSYEDFVKNMGSMRKPRNPLTGQHTPRAGMQDTDLFFSEDFVKTYKNVHDDDLKYIQKQIVNDKEYEQWRNPITGAEVRVSVPPDPTKSVLSLSENMLRRSRQSGSMDPASHSRGDFKSTDLSSVASTNSLSLSRQRAPGAGSLGRSRHEKEDAASQYFSDNEKGADYYSFVSKMQLVESLSRQKAKIQDELRAMNQVLSHKKLCMDMSRGVMGKMNLDDMTASTSQGASSMRTTYPTSFPTALPK
jgi:hypothetical protein